MSFVSRIYSDFSADIRWVRNTVLEQSLEIPDQMREIVEYYLYRRLTIIPDSRHARALDPLFGSPDPYTVFWLADALGLSERLTVRRLALGMVHATLSITLRDDMVDRNRWPRHHYLWFSDFCFGKYHSEFKRLFDRSSDFWYHFSNAIAETSKYEAWRMAFARPPSVNPYSPRFLVESSRYFVSVVAPTLVAVAFKARRTQTIPWIMKFVRDFAMAWRIFDDLCDWEEDLKAPFLNCSSVLYRILASPHRPQSLERAQVVRAFASRNFVEETYGAILGFLDRARTDLVPLRSDYLETFIDEQTTFHELRRDKLLGSIRNFEDGLAQLLSR